MNRSIIRVACRGLLAALLFPLAATAAPGDPLGPETRINTPGTPDGIYAGGPVVALQDSGAFVLTWTETGASSSRTQVMARRFDAAGNAVGPVLAISGVESKAVHGNQALRNEDPALGLYLKRYEGS
ncbi:hypothetical protein [Solimonas sp. SE-A11]|uniref:hypothetical protein n=1 Tax=Solimonas sp. SE-A11 TaxID=3054954 RepID=UPI00259CF6BC|nr:hypothetical protein [Solimonas sp. SE-A11]MDM4769017.1 hypothetical protein [Solimonas sp. SE-A11]